MRRRSGGTFILFGAGAIAFIVFSVSDLFRLLLTVLSIASWVGVGLAVIWLVFIQKQKLDVRGAVSKSLSSVSLRKKAAAKEGEEITQDPAGVGDYVVLTRAEAEALGVIGLSQSQTVVSESPAPTQVEGLASPPRLDDRS